MTELNDTNAQGREVHRRDLAREGALVDVGAVLRTENEGRGSDEGGCGCDSEEVGAEEQVHREGRGEFGEGEERGRVRVRLGRPKVHLERNAENSPVGSHTALVQTRVLVEGGSGTARARGWFSAPAPAHSLLFLWWCKATGTYTLVLRALHVSAPHSRWRNDGATVGLVWERTGHRCLFFV